MLIHKIFVLFLAFSHLLLSPLSATSRNVMGEAYKARQADDDEVLMKGDEEQRGAVLGGGEEEFGFILEGRGRMKIEINDYESAGPNKKHDSDAPPGPGNGNGKGNR